MNQTQWMEQTQLIRNDFLLIRSAQKGQQEAFAELYTRYRERIYRYFYSRVGNRSDAEELTSRTFMAALEGMNSYRHRGKFLAWLFSIAHHKAMDFFRQQHNLSDGIREDHVALLHDPQYLQGVIESERAEALAAVIRTLPAERKEWLRLRFVVGLTYKEMADILGRNPAAVKKSVYRLIEQLKREMEEFHA